MPFSCFKKKSNLVEDNAIPASSELNSDIGNGKESFFVITTIFNPASFQSRYELYHQFAQHMAQTGAQLITIECIFPELNQHEFQVTSSANPYHIQLKSKSIYWMKENLINIAASHLPEHAKWICWLDADIYFEDKNWIQLTVKALRKYTVVQVFKKCKFLGPRPEEKVLRVDYSFGYSVVHGKPIDQKRYDEWYPHPGYGWATTVPAFHLMNGLPDYDILGSADLHFAFSLLNKVSNAIESDLTLAFTNLILEQSEKTFSRLAQFSPSGSTVAVGYVPITICHNWHGSREDRQYVNRWKILIAHHFDFQRDMTRTEDGLLQFVAGRESLQRDILDHFHMRKEDGIAVEVKTKSTHRKEVLAQPKQFSSSSPTYRPFIDESAVVVTSLYPDVDPSDEYPPCVPCPPDETGDPNCEHTTVGSGGYVDDYFGTVNTSSYY